MKNIEQIIEETDNKLEIGGDKYKKMKEKDIL